MVRTPKELVRLLKKNGWYEVKQEGSHLRLRKERLQRYYRSNTQQGYGKRLTDENTKAGGD